MPNYKVVNADQLDTDLTTVSDAIQAKAGTSEKLVFPDGFISAISEIQSGSVSAGITSTIVVGTDFYAYAYVDRILSTLEVEENA